LCVIVCRWFAVGCVLFVVGNEALFSCCVLGHRKWNIMLHCRCQSSETTQTKLLLWAKSCSESLLDKTVTSIAAVLSWNLLMRKMVMLTAFLCTHLLLWYSFTGFIVSFRLVLLSVLILIVIPQCKIPACDWSKSHHMSFTNMQCCPCGQHWS